MYHTRLKTTKGSTKMYMVQCKNQCGTWLPANGNKPTLKSCGKPYCAYNAWKELADKHKVGDFFEW